MAEGFDLALKDWLKVLAELWSSVGKDVDVKRLEAYRKSLESVPLGLLELAVRRVIRENVYNVVPLPGEVWGAVRRELGDPREMGEAIERWLEMRWEALVG